MLSDQRMCEGGLTSKYNCQLQSPQRSSPTLHDTSSTGTHAQKATHTCQSAGAVSSGYCHAINHGYEAGASPLR
ncbi:Hypothetical predicted protein [Scomber scombrus]|uniref:Uncharacterized protein n=1 Tax=Scomber scombrus TaxID=13677 RepID=A0AAV1NQZ1_SCOSC